MEERWANMIILQDSNCVTSFDMASSIDMAPGIASNIDVADNVGYTMRREGQHGSGSRGIFTPVAAISPSDPSPVNIASFNTFNYTPRASHPSTMSSSTSLTRKKLALELEYEGTEMAPCTRCRNA